MKFRTMLIAGPTIPAVLAIAQPPSKPDAKPSPTGTQSADIAFRESMRAQETKVWETIAHQDWATFGAFLAEGFVEVGGGGYQDKAATLASIKDGKLTKYALSDWRATKLGETGAVVMYKSDQEWTGSDGKASHDVAYCTSVWLRQGDKWLAVSHQESRQPAAAPEKKPDAPKPAAK